MLIRTSELKNFVLAATDDEIGRCRDFLFDDQSWTVRYMEANTGKWLLGRRVLISPAALDAPMLGEKWIPVNLAKSDIENAPGIDKDQPVSRQYEESYSNHFGYAHYWLDGGVWGTVSDPDEVLPPTAHEEQGKEATADEHLRSTGDVRGYVIHASDGDIGAVDDFVLDTETWAIVLLSIDTRRWLPGKKVLLPVAWATGLSWSKHELRVDVSKDALRSAPEMEEPITREQVKEFYEHFGRSLS